MATIKFQGNPLHTSGELPAVGSKAPDFTLFATIVPMLFRRIRREKRKC